MPTGKIKEKRDGLQCFVAMALRDDSDTDALHFNVIKPVLRNTLGVRAYRIDEIHHGENIDTRIMKEIDKADFMLADLTYARPSVYFEAGYAMARDLPVIFTCRADHFSRKSEYEVHFDVRQRAIIPWSNPGDRRFPPRLLTRTRALVRPLQERRRAQEMVRQQEARFLALPPTERIRRIIVDAVSAMRQAGFSAAPERDSGVVRCYRKRRRGLETLYVVVGPDAPKRALSMVTRFGFRQRRFRHVGEREAAAVERMALRRHFDHVVLASLSRVPAKRVEAVLPDFTLRAEGTWTKTDESLYRESEEHHMAFHIVDNLRSVEEFSERFERLLSTIWPPLWKTRRE